MHDQMNVTYLRKDCEKINMVIIFSKVETENTKAPPARQASSELCRQQFCSTKIISN